jgi:hypothetical protein
MPFPPPLPLSSSLKQVFLCSYRCRYINLKTILCNKFSLEINWTFCKKRIPTPSDGQCAGCDLSPPLTGDLSPPSYSYCPCRSFASRHGYFLLCLELKILHVGRQVCPFLHYISLARSFLSDNLPFRASYILSFDHFFYFFHYLFHHL